MSRLPPTPNTVKKLFALSGNRCAFPGCNFLLVDNDRNLLGQICHIEAAEEGGERYNSEQTDEERRSFENLILLCANHHIVTNDIDKYTVEKLKKMKNNHESQFVEKPHEISDELVDKILAKYSNNFFALPINVGNGLQINQFGISYSEAKDLFFVLFDNNFPKLQKIAEETARNCVRSFRERFFYFASEYLNENDLDAFKAPDVQYVLFRAIESSARFESENLRSVLSSLLIRRIKAKEEELKKILYDEAITTVGKVSINQLKILTLHYLLYKQVFFIEPISWEELERFYTEKVTPFLDFRDTTADFSYLDYCGCCSVDAFFGSTSYAQIIKNKLNFLFPELEQEEHEQAYIEDEIRKNLTLGDYLINLWSSTDIGALNLTAVGMVIVEVFYESYTGERGFIKLEHIFNNKMRNINKGNFIRMAR